jgi:CheY-like chemotaxis protein
MTSQEEMTFGLGAFRREGAQDGMSKALRILILEDQPADVELVARGLRKAGFEFAARNVTTEKEFLVELQDHASQLILAGYSLPGYDGLSAPTAAQKRKRQARCVRWGRSETLAT